jgi:aryl-alcohol dehydrogenase-like predicted oxidoreductase
MGGASRIALGTAQLGQAYGVVNRSGPPDAAGISAILDCARSFRADTVDTAMSYGASEEALGSAGVDGLRVITKLPALDQGEKDVGRWVDSLVRRSLARLRVARLHGLLLHRSSDALGDRGGELLAALNAIRESGLVDRIGVSVYSPDDLEALEGTITYGLVQLPYNVLDRRFDDSGWLSRLRARGVEIHVRSVFLQGLLVAGEDRIPPAFARWSPTWSRWFNWVREQGTTPVSAALVFALSNKHVDRVVVGVESATQLREIALAAGAPALQFPADIAVSDLSLINPTNWKSL